MNRELARRGSTNPGVVRRCLQCFRIVFERDAEDGLEREANIRRKRVKDILLRGGIKATKEVGVKGKYPRRASWVATDDF